MSLLKRYLPGAEVTPFVIVCLPRTGSNLLGEMLDTHPEVLCHMEIFNPKSTYLSRKPHLSASIGTKEQRDQDPWTFLHNVYAVTDGRRVIGFKLMPNHNNRVLLSVLLNRRVRKIVLHRPNVLQTYVSTCIALQTQQWQVRTDGSSGNERSSIKVDVDIGAFKRYAAKVRLFNSIIGGIEAATAQRFCHVNYPQLSEERVTTELMQFLGIDSAVQLKRPLKKQNASGLAQKVANYDEVRRELGRHPQFAALLEPET